MIATYRSSDLLLSDHSLRDAAAELAVTSPHVGNITLDSLSIDAIREYLS